MNNSPRLTVRLEISEIADLDTYCTEHGLTKSQAIRIALERLQKAKPTAPERERATYPMGRPADAD